MALPPLCWQAEEDLVYDQEANELHRAECPSAIGAALARGDVLELVWAPNMCVRCSPDVTMALGRSTVA